MDTQTNPFAELTDEDLMILVSQNVVIDPIALLFERHNRGLYNFIAWINQGGGALAEDICQKTWLKIMQCTSYLPEASFRTFLYTIARNVLKDVKKSAYEKHEILDGEEESIPTDDLGPETTLALQEDISRVHQALLELPVLQREVVVLRFFSQMALEEIADLVGVGAETVKSRLRYAYARLRRELGDIQ